MDMQINFPHLGIYLEHVGKTLDIHGFSIAYYGIVIALGMVLAICLILHVARKTGQNPDLYYNASLLAILFGVCGARFYYVIFEWDYYSTHPSEILNLRHGGLAIYGGIIFGTIAVLVYAGYKKVRFTALADVLVLGGILGQILGRWGNFFNREAFGQYTDGLFAMQLPVSAVREGEITQQMWDHAVTVSGVEYIQVSPTFLYESLWNLCLFIILLLLTRKKKYDGQVFYTYLCGYGLGRMWIEGLRTDQLLLPVVGLPVSQCLSLCLFVAAGIILLVKYRRYRHMGQIISRE